MPSPASKESMNQLNRDIEGKSFFFENYLKEKYAADFQDRGEDGPKKLNTADFKELHQAFTKSLNIQLSDDDYFTLLQVTDLADFSIMLNELQAKYLRNVDVGESIERTRVTDTVPLSDCLVTEIDSVGCLKGFKLRSEMIALVHWRDNFDLKNVLKIIKIVNHMNRLLQQGEVQKAE